MSSSNSPERPQTAPPNVERQVRIACVLALVALALIIFSLLVPKPLPVIVAMSVAQGIGTLSLLVFLRVVIREVWRAMGTKASASTGDRQSEAPPAA
ncbi:MAG: hypothetical protein IPM54_37810 [Polyangiaceae bacterium]|nr:hypothetical protein [Polyangiaceae bacterium]